jgi:hypothetical protein
VSGLGYKAGPAINSPNSIRSRKSRTPAQFTTFDTAIYLECNPQSGADTLRGRAPLVRRPCFNKCALTGDSSPKETGGLGWEVSGKNTTVILFGQVDSENDHATRQISRCKQYTPFPWADAHFETGFELPKPRFFH